MLLVPGRTGGALEFRRTLHEAGCRARILLGETSTFPFACRTTGPTSATVFGIKTDVLAAALPATRTPELLAAWQPLLPMLSAAESVLHTGLSNFGAILHPVITLLNARRIACGEAFDFYSEGVTPRVAGMLAGADAERLRIAAHYGVPATTLPEWIAESYGHRADNVEKAVAGNPHYVGIKAPTSLDHRYLREDVPTGLVPMIELARVVGVAVPTLRSLVGLAESFLDPEIAKNGRTLASLGLAGRGIADIRCLVVGEGAGRLARRILVPRRNRRLVAEMSLAR